MNPFRALEKALWIKRCAVANSVDHYDRLTDGDIRADNEARPVVAGELASALDINFDEAAQLLADALARRATNKQR